MIRWGVAVMLITLACQAQRVAVRSLRDTGPSSQRINVAILGDGFTAAEENDFFTAAEAALVTIITDESLSSFAAYINGTAIFTESAESGTGIPAENLAPDTYFGASFTAETNSRLVYMQEQADRLKANDLLIEHVPEYDYAVMIINSTRYGGSGGIPLTFTRNVSSVNVLLHESGHSFAGLADEYVDEAQIPFHPPSEFPNSTQNAQRATLPWSAFVAPSTPLPTPGSPETPAATIGAFEGSHYRATGAYRPTYDSKMRSLNGAWGAVNLRAFALSVHALDLSQSDLPPIITSQPDPSDYTPGSALELSAAVDGGGPFTYQWTRDGRYLAGEISPRLNLADPLASENHGAYALQITNAVGTTTSRRIVLDAAGARIVDLDTPSGPGRLTNMSVRTLAGTGDQTLTLGFVISGTDSDTTATKQLLVRAIGPGLQPFGLVSYLPDPQLAVAPLDASSPAVTNDNWGGASALSHAFASVGAFPLDNPDSLDAALVLNAPPQPHTAQVSNSLDVSGVALVEVYDLDGAASPRLVNLSARSVLQPGNDALIAGFVYAGDSPKRFLIRAVGPGLTTYGVSEPLPDPQLVVHSLVTGEVIATNDDWSGDSELNAAFGSVGAFPLLDPASGDAALILDLPSGPYTATVRNVSNGLGFGTVLIEVYELP
ncbi:M64 family metallopeptidase [Synoicihabitans lomoniglobus]|nr:M64 family metallo-endopeptidase [Opitutaceae bacterium LMO-M01]